MMTRRDPWVNMLRTTLACLGAGVGGADSVTVLPFDHALGLPDAFARRIARNTSTILMEESHLARVIDPAGGSWYVERLTTELADAAWAFFQEIERAGGQAAALGSGLIGERLAATWAARSKDLARRKEPVTGVSEFPHLAERLVERKAAPAADGASGGLPTVRRDEAFEALRARSDAHLAETGKRPRCSLRRSAPRRRTPRGPRSPRTCSRRAGSSPCTTRRRWTPRRPPRPSRPVVPRWRACVPVTRCTPSGRMPWPRRCARPVPSGCSSRGKPAEYPGVDEYVFAGCDVVAVLSSVLDRMGVA